jgi:N-acetylglutamate synthase-like GNAT family acetyltransferase
MIEREITIEDPKFQFATRMASVVDLAYAPVISAWTKDAGTMLPKSPEELAELFLQDRSAIVVNALGEVVSHAAASFIYPDGSIEFGALVTGEEYKGKGAATLVSTYLLGNLGEKYPGKQIFALANPVSAKLFEKLGGVVVEYSAVTNEVWQYCEDCPNNPNLPEDGEEYVFIGCCDTPYDLTDVALSIAHKHN